MDKNIRGLLLTIAFIAALVTGLYAYRAWCDYDVVHRQQLMEYERQKTYQSMPSMPFYFQPQPSVPREKRHYSYEFELPSTPKQA